MDAAIVGPVDRVADHHEITNQATADGSHSFHRATAIFQRACNLLETDPVEIAIRLDQTFATRRLLIADQRFHRLGGIRLTEWHARDTTLRVIIVIEAIGCAELVEVGDAARKVIDSFDGARCTTGGRFAVETGSRDKFIGEAAIGPVGQPITHRPLFDISGGEGCGRIERGVAFGINSGCSRHNQ